MIVLLYFPPNEVFEYLPTPQAAHERESASHSDPVGQASVGSSVGSGEGAGVVGSGDGGGETAVGSDVGEGVGQGEPRSSLPVVTCQSVVTPLERACTCVGTSSQSWFEKNSKLVVI